MRVLEARMMGAARNSADVHREAKLPEVQFVALRRDSYELEEGKLGMLNWSRCATNPRSVC